MLVIIEQKYLENLTYHARWHSIFLVALREEGVSSKGEHIKTGGREIMSPRMFTSHIIFLSKYLVHKLLPIITRFFAGFIEIPSLLKISVLGNYISFLCLVYS